MIILSLSLSLSLMNTHHARLKLIFFYYHLLFSHFRQLIMAVNEILRASFNLWKYNFFESCVCVVIGEMKYRTNFSFSPACFHIWKNISPSLFESNSTFRLKLKSNLNVLLTIISDNSFSMWKWVTMLSYGLLSHLQSAWSRLIKRMIKIKRDTLASVAYNKKKESETTRTVLLIMIIFKKHYQRYFSDR